MTSLVDPALIHALGHTLVSFLWQGTVAAFLLAVGLAIVGRRSAELRYILACATLLLMLAAPVATLIRALGNDGPPIEPLPSAAPIWVPAGSSASAPMAPGGPDVLALVVTLWAAGVTVLSLRSLGGFALTLRLRRTGRALPELEELLARLAERLRVSRPVRLAESAAVAVPTVLGGLRPVILLPLSAATGLGAEALELILAHELAHVRRSDYVVNLAQTAIETVLFYHPATWWVSRTIRVERENCCDDLTLAACGKPLVYARALADLEKLRGQTPALALAASGGSLIARIRRIVGEPSHGSRPWGLPALAVLSGLAFALGGGSLLARGRMSLAPVMGPSDPAPEAPEMALAAPAPQEPAPAPRPNPTPRHDAPRTTETHTSTVVDTRTTTEEKRTFSVEKIVELVHAGVTPEWVDEMSAAGYPSASIDELIEMRRNGVGPEYVKELSAFGYPKLGPADLVALRREGVTGAFIGALNDAGLAHLSLDELRELRSQGVSGSFVREFKALGYNLSATELEELRNQGVTGRFAAGFRELGYEQLSVSRLIALRAEGVSPEYARELKALGIGDLTIPVLIALRNQGVTAEYVKEMAGAGYKSLSVADLLTLRAQGVTGRFASEMAVAGYPNLSAADLVKLRAQGVTAVFVREVQRAGFDHPTVDALIELRASGVQGSLLEKLRGKK
jgi:beta-lactamase regulating signal transducer with metallopeptidase domain